MSVQAVSEQHVATLLAVRWEQVTQKIADLAEAIPPEDFKKAPVPGIRAFDAVLRHVAFWNRYVADSLAGRDPNDTGDELLQAEYPDRKSVLDELPRTSREVASTLRNHPEALSAKTAELIVPFLEHTSEHYGQLVVYARLMGIVPPASRG